MTKKDTSSEFVFEVKDYPSLVRLATILSAEFPALPRALIKAVKNSKLGVVINITPLVEEQTSKQRGYYHREKGKFAEWCGNTPDEMHEHILSEAYGSEQVKTKTGYVRRPMQRSSAANRTEYSLLIETLIRTAAGLGYVVPPPIRFLPTTQEQQDG